LDQRCRPWIDGAKREWRGDDKRDDQRRHDSIERPQSQVHWMTPTVIENAIPRPTVYSPTAASTESPFALYRYV
jgi:hypothetical protein